MRFQLKFQRIFVNFPHYLSDISTIFDLDRFQADVTVNFLGKGVISEFEVKFSKIIVFSTLTSILRKYGDRSYTLWLTYISELFTNFPCYIPDISTASDIVSKNKFVASYTYYTSVTIQSKLGKFWF